ncbi:MAG: hypothetical protein E2O84_01135 [Bacteroidetes bacterium]|nr:MAG: hypothetical protein E2O84_01135 [Bacteroidota bacterium]
MDDFGENKDLFISYLSRQLIGPADGDGESFTDRPNDRYLMGILFPRDIPAEHVLEDEDETQVAAESDDSGEVDTHLSMIYQRMPASVGISFYIENVSELNCHVIGARYEEVGVEDGNGKKRRKKWVRICLACENSPESVSFDSPKKPDQTSKPVFDGRGSLIVVWRKLGKGWLTTVTLSNTARNSENSRLDPADCLFQVGLRCTVTEGIIKAYPTTRSIMSDPEEQELELQYRDKKPYAIGHGCAADWDRNTGKSPSYVCARFLPVVEVKPVTTALEHSEGYGKVFSLQYLSRDTAESAEVAASLRKVTEGYKRWQKDLTNISVPSGFNKAASRIAGKIKSVIVRLESGIACLERNPVAFRAFKLANKAMLISMIHGQEKFAGTVRSVDSAIDCSPDYLSDEYKDFTWRPFQLAFQLLLVDSLANEDSEDREIVDLIWFPTGGGKTEAYLAVAAFEMIYRRLTLGARGGGTAVIKRYTLRLLTIQQFQRAAGLITALEYMRRRTPEELGDEEFSLGLWVGGASTPNSFTSASDRDKGSFELYEQVLEEEKPENYFQLRSCPWCGTRILPEYRRDDADDYGIRASQTSFEFFCVSRLCEFHEHLPIAVVDQGLFQSPPTLLIGTIDKFARLAWDHRGRAFFAAGETDTEPPGLIIQDELHLISGPLGTIAGIYEAAMDVAMGKAAKRPKIIAATATIRRAEEQVQRLYGRPVSVFPPPGLNADDSYFSRTDKNALGRFYIGVMGQGHTPVTSLVQTAAALCQGPMELNISDLARDTWWTQVIYHNSRRELGKTMTLARDDIDARVRVIAADESAMRSIGEVEELSSNVPGSRINEVLGRLGIKHPHAQVLDIVPCTNMISVGVDVGRLGLILINGQPKTTAEYIQASSRIGRSAQRPPGLVVALYSATKPRDRSHYESFVSYHSALYRHVEPTSVTPFAPPARDRALHAAMIVVMRLAGGLPLEEDAERFDPQDPNTVDILATLKKRMADAEPAEARQIVSAIDALCDEWVSRIEDARNSGKPIRYFNKGGKQFASLMCHFENKTVNTWPTLNSMRHVDPECNVRVLGENRE